MREREFSIFWGRDTEIKLKPNKIKKVKGKRMLNLSA